MPVEISNSHLLPECALYRQQHLFRGMIQVDGDVVPGRSALPRHDLRVAFGLRSRRASQFDDQIRRIRVPRSFGRIAGVAALALGESVIQDDHAAAAGAESLPTRRTAVSRSTVQDQNIQLPGQPGRDPIHQGRAFVLVFALEHDHEAAARECPPGNDQRAEDSPVKSHRQPDDHAYPPSHNSAGVCGNLYGLAMGSVDNTARFEADPQHMATAVPEIYALESLGDKVVLSIVDALICQYQGEQTTLLHYATSLNQLRFSKDPVALDVLSIQELDKQRKAAGMSSTHTNSMELFENASLLELGTSDPQNIRVEMVR